MMKTTGLLELCEIRGTVTADQTVGLDDDDTLVPKGTWVVVEIGWYSLRETTSRRASGLRPVVCE